MSSAYSVEYSDDDLGDLFSKLAGLDRVETLVELSRAVDPLLASIGRYAKADRAYIFSWADDDHTMLTNTYEWCAEGIEPQIGNLQHISASDLPYWMGRFAHDQAIVIPDLKAARPVMPSEYEILAPQAIDSLIAFPIFVGKALGGFMGVDNPSEASRDALAANLLLAVSGHLGSLYENLRIRRALEEHQRRLEAAVDEARRANFAKTDFLRRMSHDVRTPINGIRGMIEIANHYPDDLARQQECRDKIWKASGYLLSLVSNILDISKLESGDIVLEHKPFSLIDVLNELNVVCEMRAAEKAVSYLYDTEPGSPSVAHWNLIGSPTHLKQVLMNIGANAVKYTPPHGSIRVGVEELGFDGERATYRFTCSDTGIGMSPDFQSHVYEPFRQEQRQDLRNNVGGSGLGLAIAKGLVDQMGGTIGLSSDEGVGTTFTIEIPFEVDLGAADEPAETGVPTRPKELPGSAKGELRPDMSVLLVEDNDLNMEIARFFFEQNGVCVTEAYDGQEALETFEKSAPGDFDAIFMDVMMPVMDGLAATRAIRGLDRPDAQTIPIYAMTANAFTDDVRRSLDAGMNGHIVKPLEERKLINALRRCKARKA